MGVYIKGMEMPKDCPMCIAAHYNKLDEFTGCEIVPGKKYAVQRDAEYAKSSTRPDWCPLFPVPPHGRLIDGDALIREHRADNFDFAIYACYLVQNAPTVIEAEEGE